MTSVKSTQKSVKKKKKFSQKFPGTWKLNSTLTSDPWCKEEITGNQKIF